ILKGEILMAEEKIIMPQLGESVTEGTINTWLVKEGDFVNEYDPLVEVMTDKVNAEVPSSFTGTIKEIVENEGSTVKVGNLLGYIETEEKEAAAQTTDNKDRKSTRLNSSHVAISYAVFCLKKKKKKNQEKENT